MRHNLCIPPIHVILAIGEYGAFGGDLNACTATHTDYHLACAVCAQQQMHVIL